MQPEDAKRAKTLVDQVRRRLQELADERRESDPTLAAELIGLAESLSRSLGLSAAPLASSYRHQVAVFQRWLREQGGEAEPPISAELVLRYLTERRTSVAAASVTKDAYAIRQWHRAGGHADPTATPETAALLAELRPPSKVAPTKDAGDEGESPSGEDEPQ